MNANEQWLKARQAGIGGSDIGAILGVSKFASPVDVFLKKTQPVVVQEPSEAMYWGTVLEDVVALEFKRRSGMAIQRVNSMLRHPEHDWMLANIDRAIVEPEIAKNVRWNGERLTTNSILEVKTANAFSAKQWGEEGTDELPLSYNAQAQWYLGVTKAQVCHFAVLIGGSDYRQYTVERDDELIAHMIEQGRKFWFDHVLKNIPPEPMSAEDAAKLWPKDDGGEVEAGDSEHTAYLKLQGIKKDLAELTKAKDELENDLKLRLGSNASLTWNGSTLATWKAGKDSKKTDWAAVAADLEQQVEREKFDAAVRLHTEQKAGSRRFVLK